MERIAERKAEAVVLKVRRGIRTLFVELQSTWATGRRGDERAKPIRGLCGSGRAMRRRAWRALTARWRRVHRPIDAQDDRAAGREIVKKWQSAIVNVRVVLKMRVSVGGREMQSMDESVETVGTVIDPSGLTVLSLGALNPGA